MPLPLGFLDVSGISLLDSSASVWPSLPSFPELTSTAMPAAGLEDVGSSSGSHERGGEWLAPAEASGKAVPFLHGSEAGVWEESGHVKVFVHWLSSPSVSGVGSGGQWGYCPRPHWPQVLQAS